MTADEVRAAWLRYIHRNDLAADIDRTETLAAEKIAERTMRKSDAIPTMGTAPRLYLHAGLCYLHELAQDDEGLAREQTLFEDAATSEHFRWSLDNTTPDMLAR